MLEEYDLCGMYMLIVYEWEEGDRVKKILLVYILGV